MLYSRAELIQDMILFLEPLPNVVAAWEGGSQATGRLDHYSDIDLTIVISDTCADDVFALLDAFFVSKYGILRKYRLAEPTWHGMSQCFYMLDKLQHLVYADIAIVNKDVEDKFTETDRHGRAKLYFDKLDVYIARESTTAKIQERCKKIYETVVAMDFILFLELDKASARDNALAIKTNWLGVIHRCLIPLMNIKYRPAKADFGIRYIDTEYPAPEADFIISMLYLDSPEQIVYHTDTLKLKYQALVEELSYLR